MIHHAPTTPWCGWLGPAQLNGLGHLWAGPVPSLPFYTETIHRETGRVTCLNNTAAISLVLGSKGGIERYWACLYYGHRYWIKISVCVWCVGTVHYCWHHYNLTDSFWPSNSSSCSHLPYQDSLNSINTWNIQWTVIWRPQLKKGLPRSWQTCLEYIDTKMVDNNVDALYYNHHNSAASAHLVWGGRDVWPQSLHCHKSALRNPLNILFHINTFFNPK